MNKFINIILILSLIFVWSSAQTTAPTGTVQPAATPTPSSSSESPATPAPTPASTPAPTPAATPAPTPAAATPSPAPTASPIASIGYVTRTDYQDSSCTTQLRTATFAINTCSTGWSYPVYYTDGRSSPISISFYNNSGCGSENLVVHSNFNNGECIPGTPLSVKYTYSSTVPLLESGVYTFTQFSSNSSACSGSLMAVTQLQGICFLKPSGSFQSQKIVCSGTTSYTTTSCTDDACSQGCVSSVTQISNAGCSIYDHTYNSCSAAPGTYPVVPTKAPVVSATGGGETFDSGSEAATKSTTTGNSESSSSTGTTASGQTEGSGAAGSSPVHASCAGWGSTLSVIAMMAGSFIVLL